MFWALLNAKLKQEILKRNVALAEHAIEENHSCDYPNPNILATEKNFMLINVRLNVEYFSRC